MWQNPKETEDLATFIEEILNGKLFLCSATSSEIYKQTASVRARYLKEYGSKHTVR